MGEIRFVGTGETRGYPYPVCKKRFVGTGETRGYPYLVCKKVIAHIGADSFLQNLTFNEKGGKKSKASSSESISIHLNTLLNTINCYRTEFPFGTAVTLGCYLFS